MNSSKVRGVLGGVIAASLLFGCGILKKKQPDPAPSATVAVQTGAPVVAPSPVATPPLPAEPVVADEAIAAPEDFEDEAFEKVSDKTYKVELETLKKEIEAK